MERMGKGPAARGSTYGIAYALPPTETGEVVPAALFFPFIKFLGVWGTSFKKSPASSSPYSYFCTNSL